jgi:hypothetical protein
MVSGSLGPSPATLTTFNGSPIAGALSTREPELSVGDLILWTGKQTEYSSMRNRVIYQVTARETTAGSSYSHYRFRPVFDFENPMGTDLTVNGTMTIREMKRLTLLDLGVLRLMFDHFVREWARSQGTEVEQMPTADDIS